MRSLKDISGKNGNSDPYLRQCYYIIILCIAVFSEQDIVFNPNPNPNPNPNQS